jgi:asparagine synthase (glutamine-hydrolysing)
MCGIAAIFAGEQPLTDAERDIVGAMTSVLRHRGPDATGFRFDPRFVLGNTRLRILDLRREADLPMVSDDGEVLLAYNGEITNHLELRARFLDDGGPAFHTGSDTEVLLRLYRRLGLDFLRHLTGQFAFVLVDRRVRRAWVVRDFFGIRPMFWARVGGRLHVASEIKALLEVPGVDRTIDAEGLFHYFSLAYIPEERTPFLGIRELQGSNLIEVDLESGAFHQRPYYEIRYDPDPSMTEAEAVGPLRDAMIDSVRRNLIADAPVGLTFSGGFDTSSILGIARTLRPAEELHTYSVVMEEPSFDESRWQRMMIDPARHPHHEIRVGPEQVEQALYEHLAFLDEPTGDGAAIPFYLLAKEAAKEVRVLLSGEGGDETFNAYETHLANKMRRVYRRLMPGPARKLAFWAAHALPCDYRKLSFDFLSKRFTEGAELDVPGSHLHWRHVLPESDKRALMPGCADTAPTDHLFRRLYESLPFPDELNRLSVMDIRHYFEADLMVKNDRMLMAHSIEPRLPYMDRILLEHVARIPVDLRIRRFRRRHLQRQAMRDLVPAGVYRRANMGLEMPHSVWFLGPLRAMAERLLAPGPVERTGVLDPAVVTRLWREHVERRRDNGRALWSILVLVAWFELYVDSSRYKDFLRRE